MCIELSTDYVPDLPSLLSIAVQSEVVLKLDLYPSDTVLDADLATAIPNIELFFRSQAPLMPWWNNGGLWVEVCVCVMCARGGGGGGRAGRC